MLSSRGYIVKKKNVEENKIIEELTVRPNTEFISNNSDNNESEFCVCLETKKSLFVPKYYGLQKFGLPSQISMDEPETIPCEFKGTLLENQKHPVSEYLKAAKDPLQMGGILQLPPGAGKTVMGLYITCHLKVKTLIIVHKEFLMNQWKERISQYVSNVNVGIIKQKKKEIDNHIVIASLQSICNKTDDDDLFRNFGLVIIDEVHHIGAQVFSRALLKINFKYALGLSATVNRKDGLSKVFKWFIGDVVYKVPKKENVSCNVIIKQYEDNENEEYNREFFLYNGKVNMAKMINSLTTHLPRTKFIVDCVIELLKKEPTRNVIILSDRRGHLEDMATFFKKEKYDTGMYVGGMKNADLDVSQQKQIILGTFSMVSEGFDLPKLDTLVLSTSKSDIEQSVGRIQRKHIITENDNVPTVLDIVDNFSVFGNQHIKRKKFYSKMKYNVCSE
jgi:superfamily II DNA or RNA helicase